jgi:hypothetical protein
MNGSGSQESGPFLLLGHQRQAGKMDSDQDGAKESSFAEGTESLSKEALSGF